MRVHTLRNAGLAVLKFYWQPDYIRSLGRVCSGRGSRLSITTHAPFSTIHPHLAEFQR
jgi:hypothetical protein